MTDRQCADYQHCLTVDPNMTMQHFLDLGIRVYPSYVGSETLIRRHIARAETTLYRKTHLLKFDASSWNAGRCYTRGKEKWRRQDDQPLTQQDVDAISALCYGQLTQISEGDVGDSYVLVTWACDSSD